MILIFVIAVSVLQVVAYYIIDKKNIKFGRLIVLGIILIGNVFVFPPFFYPQMDPNGVNCGMPILGITLAFWIFGGLGSIVIHFVYRFFNPKKIVI
jgi:hypothetical protein